MSVQIDQIAQRSVDGPLDGVEIGEFDSKDGVSTVPRMDYPSNSKLEVVHQNRHSFPTLFVLHERKSDHQERKDSEGKFLDCHPKKVSKIFHICARRKLTVTNS